MDEGEVVPPHRLPGRPLGAAQPSSEVGDPALIVMIDGGCGIACLPMSEWIPMLDRIAWLENELVHVRDELSEIRGLLG